MFIQNLLDATDVIADAANTVTSAVGVDSPSMLWNKVINFLIEGGEKILIAILILVIGKFLISFIKRVARKWC